MFNKRKMKKTIMKYLGMSLLLCFLLCVKNVSSQTIYLSPQGNDSNVGSKEQPLASLTGARDKIREWRRQGIAKETIVVRIQEGNYYMNEPCVFTEEDAGTSASPVVFRAENPEVRPVFCGGMNLGNFELVQEGSIRMWRTYIPETALYGFYFEQLYVNGERRFRAQTPNHGSFFQPQRVTSTALDSPGREKQALGDTKVQSPYASLKVTLKETDRFLLNELSAQDKEDALVVFYHNWDNTRRRIMFTELADTALYIIDGMAPWNPIDEKSRYVVENYRKALDAPGEWFLQRNGYLYYIPMPDETIDNVSFVAPVSSAFMKITGQEGKPVQHLRFENLCFEVAGYHTPPSGNAPIQAAAPLEATIQIDYAKHIDFQNCDIAHTGLHGIWYRTQCSDSRVEHCHLYDLGGGGVKIGTFNILPEEKITNHIVVNNSIIQHGGFVFPCSVGLIIFHGRDNEITHNDIADFRYSSISAGWVWGYGESPTKRNKIKYNHLHHLGWGELCDMGGVYTLGPSPETEISNNVVHHVYSFNYGGWGLYTDEGSSNILMENNLVYLCKNSGFHQHYGRRNLIRNNIFALNLKAQLEISKDDPELSFTFTNNIIYYNRGGLLLGNVDRWKRQTIVMDNNIIWDTRVKTPDFYGMTYAEWKTLGRDTHSVIADPLFVNPEKYDFRFRNRSVAKKIQFKPFDYSQAGVYGDETWKQEAELSPELLQKFEDLISKHEDN
jgi:hypothetical protein